MTLVPGTVLRTARKQHRCSGGHNGTQHIRCDKPILPGEKYIESFLESYAYQSGKRYHLDCATQQGLLHEEVE